jgi:GT2 family glycosyltransferase
VLRQHDARWRLSVIDDGAADGLDGDLKPWLAGLGDDRVRYLPNPHRLGINRNFQRCADEATAELVVVLGADDRLLPDFVGRVRQVATEVPDAAFVHTGAAVIDEDGRPALPLADRVKRITTPAIRGHRVMGGEELATSLLHGNWMYFPSVAFRREVLQRHGFRPGYDIVLDLDLYLRILLAGGKAVLLSEPCVEYRRHGASLSSAQALDGSRFDEELAYFGEAAGLAAAAGWPRAVRAARWHWTSRLHSVAKVPALLAAGDRRTAAALLRTAAASRPRGAPCDEGAR